MTNEELELIQEKMLEVEGELIDDISNSSFDGLLEIYHDVSNEVLESSRDIKETLEVDPEYKKEAYFSGFRILKAVLAEIEYRIRENKL